jgi:outer membrane lipopolysaccharide assembly protein LptE/RlpB
MFRNLLLIAGLALAGLGCGYRLDPPPFLPPASPSDGRLAERLALLTFENTLPQTGVAGEVDQAVREVLVRRGYSLVAPKQASILVTGKITQYERTPLSLNPKGQAEAYRLRLTATYILQAGTQRSVPQEVVGESDYGTHGGAASEQMAERNAVREASRRLGESLADHLTRGLLELKPAPLPSPPP